METIYQTKFNARDIVKRGNKDDIIYAINFKQTKINYSNYINGNKLENIYRNTLV